MNEESTWSATRPSARRSLLLCAAGALLGLSIAGLGLFTAKGTRTSSVPAEDVAIVNSVPILMSDYIGQLRGLYDVSPSQATPAQRRKVLDDMIREELYVQRGIELGVQSDTIEVRTALVGAVRAMAEADATMAQPDEPTLMAYYRSRMDRYASQGRMEVADYIVPPNVDAGAAALALRENKKPESIGLNRTQAMRDGEEFWFAAEIHLGETLFSVAKRLSAGDISRPVEVGGDVHLLAMVSNTPPRAEPFAAVRDRVLADYIDQQSKVLIAGNDRFLRKRADVVVQKGYE